MRQVEAPVHRLGLSQILAYGLLFYSFASIKDDLASRVGASDSAIITALSVALFIEALLSPLIGSLVDRLGALIVLRTGLIVGGLGYAGITLIPTIEWVWFSIAMITTGHALGTYTVAFAVPVQFNEKTARRKISVITFYGGIASSIVWIAQGALLPAVGLEYTTYLGGALLVLTGGFILHMRPSEKPSKPKMVEPFQWSLLTSEEKKALVLLASSGAVDYVNFTGLTLLFITWFSYQDFGAYAVILAAIYGPSQVVGRVFEMRYAQQFDARINCVVAMVCVAISQIFIMSNSILIVGIGMVIFGMANGIITVTFGYVPNLYFRPAVFGRAKGWIATPKAMGSAVGPAFVLALFQMFEAQVFYITMALSVVAACLFAGVLRLSVRTDVTTS